MAYDPNGNLLGFASYQTTQEADLHDNLQAVCYLYELQVNPIWQSRGVGSKLMGAVEEAKGVKQQTKIMLTVHTANKRAIRFYQKWGFVVDETSPRKILGPRHGLGYEIYSKPL